MRALGKLEQVLPARLRYRVRTLGAATSPVGGGPVVDPEVLTALAAAVAGRERVRFRYASRADADSGRLVEPLALVPSGRRWYLLAWEVERSPGVGGGPAGSGSSAVQTPPGWEGPPTLRAGTDNVGGASHGGDGRDAGHGNGRDRTPSDGWRTYRVDRIARVQPTGVRIRAERVLPAEDAASYVAGRRTDWGTPEVHAVVTFEAPASAVAGRLGDNPGEVTAVDAGRSRLDARRDDSMEWLAARLASLGCAFAVHEPDELRAAVVALGERAMAAANSHTR
ncbi:hypothetical protein C1I92_21610 [Jiangella anatolica]|uniref:Uncharacterized protein n=1 Tax=Jiangella anatolica TaxID=2670374 RepID=A0A2W2BM14_9ACTN|nr:hypothetical protein C1I92_21610 [Jiangella anatolica]